jgi:hypothetical protein
VLFDQGQLDQVPRLLDRAEELVGDRFAVTSFEAERYAYDVATLADLASDEIPQTPALAQIIRYGRSPGKRRLNRFHRICLHDGRMLECQEREALPFRALALVVLTHELIHLVRFTIPETTFHVPASRRQAEEGEVDQLTRRLLGRYPDAEVARAALVVTRH